MRDTDFGMTVVGDRGELHYRSL
ncbi:hypothetical protein ACFQ5D_01690 [Paenibacillus farraposensis]|uniref:Uncharacterized protein n=1 Tax=Paenibacillus farraposensis TaxID=2807095 RepID=A0ABW4D8V5_9BACL